MSYLQKTGIIMAIILFFAGCSKLSEKQSSTTKSIVGATSSLATVKGQVLTYSDGTNPDSDNSGITVSLEGTSYSTTTTTDGTFILSNVLPRTYVISSNKEGFSTWKVFNISFSLLGGGTYYFPALPNAILYKIPTTQITDLAATQYGTTGIEITHAQFTESALNNARVYVSTSQNGYYFYTNSSTSYVASIGKNRVRAIRGTDYYYDTGQRKINYTSGTTYYFKARPYRGTGSYISYYDYSTGEYVEPASGPWSNVVSAVMP